MFLPVGLHGGVELVNIFTHPFRTQLIHRLTRVGTGLQVRAVGVENAAVRHALRQCLLYDMVKNLLKNIAAVKAADAVLAEGGSVGHFFGQPHAQEPAVSHVDLNFLHQASFGRHAEQVAG